ncbi:Crp/Fnr family transcriptional regulator [Mycobacterium kubicae]|uniref:Crp/Fnr family transcriptional regulator n=1 Tax=Mycobacterium kubicae TaxID=120959 RepID=UPI0007FF8DC5|nr:Crp/Fnr family transcriptional regulator [Mycobacterium kubicae]OBK44067.1 hypothetical protein A5657_04780 [Mycobacterium kubicae]
MTSDDFRRNALLGQLPEREYARMRPHLRLEQTRLKQSGYEPHTPIADVYFPLSSVFSLVAVTDRRIAVEVATIGHEGMVGLPVYLGAATSPQASFCQIAGETARISVADFQQALSGGGALHQLLNRYTQATMVQVAQNVVCNSTHPTDARMARWLLTTQDRVGADDMLMTQEFLSQMLGVHRPTVSETAQRIQEQGMMRYSRGTITILNRPALEEMACECYRIVRAEFDAIRNFA